jgi:hypothetical protein
MRNVGKSLEISRSVHCLWREPKIGGNYSTAVSLHSHTLHSRESLDFVPRVLRRVPLAHAALQNLEKDHIRKKGKSIPFHRAFWRPPLNPRAAYELEAGQISKLLGLQPLVSITDHDNLEACAELDAIGIPVPYSTEWTVPYHATVFHIGVHNLPPDIARGFEAEMAKVTAAPTRERIAELLDAMHALPGVLLILNHPFSCEEMLPRADHILLLHQFIAEFGQWMHAYELNGLQPTINNTDTIRLAASHGVPVIAGGDRHCCEPNANLNLTNAASFAEFVDEVRVERRTSVLFMPQYRDPIPARYIEVIWHAVRSYPEFTGRKRWLDRVFLDCEDGETRSFATLWPDGGHPVIHAFVSLVGLLASPGIRAMMCMTLGRPINLEPEVL